MEVTTVSPSPASPTEGDDLCEIDVTNVAIHSVTLLICLGGLVGNGTVLCLLSLKGHNIFLFHLSFTDFVFLLFTIPAALVFLVEDVSCFHIIPLVYLSLLFQLSVVSYFFTLFHLMLSSSMVDMCMLCLLFMVSILSRRFDLPNRLFWFLGSVIFCVFFVLFTVTPVVTYLCPSYEQKHCRAALISMYALILLLFPAPVVISSTIKFIKAMRGSTEQQPKRRDIIMFLIVLLILLLYVCNLLQQLGYIAVSSEFLLLNCIPSSIKPFIYFLAGGFQRPCSLGSLRLSLQRVFDDQNDETACTFDAVMDPVLRAS